MTEAKHQMKIGDPDDGGIYVGLSAEDGRPLHAALADEPEYLTFDEAIAAAEKLKSLHPTAHVPTMVELNENLFHNRNAGLLKGTFNIKGQFGPGGSAFGSLYRSSEAYGRKGTSASYVATGAQCLSLDDGSPTSRHNSVRLPVRLVW